MRLSRYHIPTIKEAPADAEVISHKLMIRAGLIRKLAAGIYSLLPLGVRVIQKVENIIREEMNKEGAMEVILPSIQPSELWKESGRWDVYGKELLRMTDRHDREFCYAPTAEEVITDLVRRDVRSYRDLPVNLYQIQTKFRDEIRPRFGVMRGREFVMKDAYSFDADDKGADENYNAMRRAYTAIFSRMGLSFRAVEADTGQIGGSSSHEFMVMAESGEDTIAWCNKCDYAANIEKVELEKRDDDTISFGDIAPVKKVATPDVKTIKEVSAFLKVKPARCIKTLIYKTDKGEIFAALTHGDHDINEVKLARAIGADEVTLATEEETTKEAKTFTGFAGPVGLDIKVIADSSIEKIVNGVTGANEKDFHLTGVNPGRDFTPEKYDDIRQVVEGDSCSRCEEGMLYLAKGIEVGHIFKLGKKYSEAMNATFLDSEGKEQSMIMGCYGIGVGRTAAASIEQNNDENGIVWPVAIAPFEVIVISLGKEGEDVFDEAEKIYKNLIVAGVDAVFDDRKERPGVKFADADLVGYPLQVILGRKGLKDGVAETKLRKTGERKNIPLAGIPDAIVDMLKTLRVS